MRNRGVSINVRATWDDDDVLGLNSHALRRSLAEIEMRTPGQFGPSCFYYIKPRRLVVEDFLQTAPLGRTKSCSAVLGRWLPVYANNERRKLAVTLLRGFYRVPYT
jgi:hypothetical protein